MIDAYSKLSAIDLGHDVVCGSIKEIFRVLNLLALTLVGLPQLVKSFLHVLYLSIYGVRHHVDDSDDLVSLFGLVRLSDEQLHFSAIDEPRLVILGIEPALLA